MTSNKNIHITQQNISYYNEIAKEYDVILNEDKSNAVVRKAVKEKFVSTVNPGWVLDFGGGTGQDTGWLQQHHYSILFCEPSAGMRNIAIENVKNNTAAGKIIFMDEAKINFKNWDNVLPFEQKVNGVLANFAVFNCIPNIDTLFQNLSPVMQSGGHVIAVILNNSLLKLFRRSPVNFIKNIVLNKPLISVISFKAQQQTVYIHTMKEIKKAAGKYFILKDATVLKGSGFILLDLIKR